MIDNPFNASRPRHRGWSRCGAFAPERPRLGSHLGWHQIGHLLDDVVLTRPVQQGRERLVTARVGVDVEGLWVRVRGESSPVNMNHRPMSGAAFPAPSTGGPPEHRPGSRTNDSHRLDSDRTRGWRMSRSTSRTRSSPKPTSDRGRLSADDDIGAHGRSILAGPRGLTSRYVPPAGFEPATPALGEPRSIP